MKLKKLLLYQLLIFGLTHASATSCPTCSHNGAEMAGPFFVDNEIEKSEY